MSRKRKHKFKKNKVEPILKKADDTVIAESIETYIDDNKNNVTNNSDDVDSIRMTKHQITDEIIACLTDNIMTPKEVNEICFAVLYHTLLNPSNVIVMKENLGIDILQLKGNDLIDFVHVINKIMIQLKDDFSNIHQLVGDDSAHESNDTRTTI